MLDQMTLSDKVTVLRLWFQRAQDGEMPFTPYTKRRYEELLRDCAHDAAMLAARLDLALANLALAEGRHDRLPAVGEDGKVIDLQLAASRLGSQG